MSNVYIFDVRSEHEGKTCNLVFHVPVPSPCDMSPVKIRSPGGIAVSSVAQQAASARTNSNDVGGSKVIGWVPSIEPDNQYIVASVPCAAGQRAAYQVESTRGFTMDFFSMNTPPVGLSMLVSGE